MDGRGGLLGWSLGPAAPGRLAQPADFRLAREAILYMDGRYGCVRTSDDGEEQGLPHRAVCRNRLTSALCGKPSYIHGRAVWLRSRIG